MSNDSHYVVRVIDQTVHKWSKKDGQGEHVCNKGGFEIGEYPSIGSALKAIDDYFGYELENDAYQTIFIQANQIEDVNGYATPDGDYLVDYTLVIDEVRRVDVEYYFRDLS
jgi:hypothetical protein